MRMILGLDAPTSGTATVGGRPLSHHAAPLTSLGFLLDAGAVHPTRSAYDHLRALAVTNGIPTSRVDEVLDIVGLGEVGRRRSGGFSLGMGQRLGIAAALLGDPEVVMLDEPVNGLDPEGILWIRHLLQDLAKEGRTVFVSSHLMSEMELMAEHFVIIGQGRPDRGHLDRRAARAMAAGEKTQVRAERLDDLVGLMRADGVEIVSADRETVSVSGLDATEIGEHRPRPRHRPHLPDPRAALPRGRVHDPDRRRRPVPRQLPARSPPDDLHRIPHRPAHPHRPHRPHREPHDHHHRPHRNPRP